MKGAPVFPRASGAALLLVLWAITVLSFSVLWVSQLVNRDLESGAASARNLRARQLALSGVALGAHPRVTRDDTELLNRVFENGDRLQVRIIGEGARFNINSLLAQQDRPVLRNIFTQWGLPANETDALIDALIDWTDEDEMRLFNGAEKAEYLAVGIPDAPPNRPFRSVEEMGRVRGMDVVAELNPGWKEAFTIYGDGLIDVNEADAPTLQAATGLSPEMAERILATRRGPDGAEPSEDDFRFTSIEQLAGWLTSSTMPAQQVAARLSVESPVKRIDSTGFVGDCSRNISVVAAEGDGGVPGKYFLWEER